MRAAPRLIAVLGALLALSTGAVAQSDQAGDRGWFTRAVSLKHAAFPGQPVPAAVVHGRRSAEKPGPDRGAPIDLVVFLHGFRGCAVAQMASHTVACGPDHPRVPGRHLAREHARADGHTLLVVPQLRLLRRDGAAGRFARRGGFAAFLHELLDQELSEELGPNALSRVRRIALVAHSAGYQATLAILLRGDLSERITDVVLLDALYAGTAGFADWVLRAPGRRLMTLHGRSGKPARNSRVLLQRLSRAGLATANLRADWLARDSREPLPPFRAARARVATAHARLPQVHLAPILHWLSARPTAGLAAAVHQPETSQSRNPRKRVEH